jgi:hypothetical protein
MSFTQNITICILQAASFGCFEPTARLGKHKDIQNVIKVSTPNDAQETCFKRSITIYIKTAINNCNFSKLK